MESGDVKAETQHTTSNDTEEKISPVNVESNVQDNKEKVEETNLKNNDENGKQPEETDKISRRLKVDTNTKEDYAYIDELVNSTLKLKNGAEVPIFSFGPPKIGGPNVLRKFTCHICPAGDIHSASVIRQHIAGKRHQQYVNDIKTDTVHKPFFQSYGDVNGKPKLFKIFAGENIDNAIDYEDRITDANDLENQLKSGAKDTNNETEDNSNVEEVDIKSEEDLAYINKLVETKMKMPDGSEVHMFSYGPPKKGAHVSLRPFTCHLCYVSCSHKMTTITTHVGARRHQTNLINTTVINPKKPYLLPYDGKMTLFRIFPGENIESVLPDYGKRLVHQDPDWEWKPISGNPKEIKKLQKDPIYEYNKRRPLIGLDYLVKYTTKLGKLRRYCTLCKDEFVKTNFEYTHVTGGKHQKNYISKHFPRLMARVNKAFPDISNTKRLNHLRDIARILYQKIERKFGLKQYHLVEITDFCANREQYIRTIQKFPHYDENSMEFDNEEIEHLISKCKEGVPIIDPDSAFKPRDEAEVAATDRINKYKNDPNEQMPQIEPPMTEDQRKKWSTYKSLKGRKLKSLMGRYKGYEKKPEKHPEYENKRKAFLAGIEREGAIRNPKNYNADKDWRFRWRQSLSKLYDRDFQKMREDLRLEVGLPVRGKTPEVHNYLPGSVPTDRFLPREQRAQQPRRDPSPREREHSQRSVSTRNREPLTVITVMRLLAALEDILGSLGPKSLNLLSEAVLFERKNRNLNELLVNYNIYTFFATVKEKLTGQMMANLVEPPKINAVNMAIDDLTQIIQVMETEASKRANGGNQTDYPDYGRSEQNTGNFGSGNQGIDNDWYSNTNIGRGDENNRKRERDSMGYSDNRESGVNSSKRANFGDNSVGFGNNSAGNYRSSGFDNNNANNRMNMGQDNGNYYRDSNIDGNYRNDSNNFSSNRGGSSTNDRNYNEIRDYRSNDSSGGSYGGNTRNASSGNYGGNIMNSGGGNYGYNQSNSRGNDLTGNYTSRSTGSYSGGANASASSNYACNTNQYRSDYCHNDNLYSKPGGGSNQRNISNFATSGNSGRYN